VGTADAEDITHDSTKGPWQTRVFRHSRMVACKTTCALLPIFA
jgi:hypothetical protein